MSVTDGARKLAHGSKTSLSVFRRRRDSSFCEVVDGRVQCTFPGVPTVLAIADAVMLAGAVVVAGDTDDARVAGDKVVDTGTGRECDEPGETECAEMCNGGRPWFRCFVCFCSLMRRSHTWFDVAEARVSLPLSSYAVDEDTAVEVPLDATFVVPGMADVAICGEVGDGFRSGFKAERRRGTRRLLVVEASCVVQPGAAVRGVVVAVVGVFFASVFFEMSRRV